MATGMSRKMDLRVQISALEAELKQLEKLPTEPRFGQTVKFTKRMGSTRYTWAAVRTAAGWFITGQDGSRRRTWQEIVDLADGSQIQVSSAWVNVEMPQDGSRVYTLPESAKYTLTHW